VTTKKYCQGCSLTGHWKGYDCSNEAKFTAGGKDYCGQHFSIATYNPERFTKARELRAKQEARNRARLVLVK